MLYYIRKFTAEKYAPLLLKEYVPGDFWSQLNFAVGLRNKPIKILGKGTVNVGCITS
jgi:hypothetical protein